MKLLLSTSILFVIIIAIVSVSATKQPEDAGDIGMIQYLDRFDPNALCIDGTPAALYYFKGEDPTSVIFHMQGGGICSSPETCYARSLTRLGSSKNYPKTLPSSEVFGVLSRNCTINPNYCKFSVAYLQYCDGTLYAANNTNAIEYTDPTTDKTYPLLFRGDFIRKAALKFLAYNGNINKVRRIQYQGGSAGAVSTFIHSEYDIADLLSNIPSLTTAAAVPLSGLFPPGVNWEGVPISKYLQGGIFKIANISFSSLNQACLADKGDSLIDQAKCASPVVAYNYSTVPTFVSQSSLDLWQALCDVAGELIDNKTSEKCHATSLYANTQCPNATFPSAPPNVYPLATCNASQVKPLLAWQNIVFKEMPVINGFKKPNNGLFLVSCLTHVIGESWQWNSVRIGGMTLNNAVWNWFNTLPGNQQRQQQPKTDNVKGNPLHTHIDCVRSEADAGNNYECNPSCVIPTNNYVDASSYRRPEHMKNRHYWDGKTDL